MGKLRSSAWLSDDLSGRERRLAGRFLEKLIDDGPNGADDSRAVRGAMEATARQPRVILKGQLAVIGFGLVEGCGSLVKLLLAREVLCRERRRSRVVDLRKCEIGFSDTKILRRRVDFFFADARVDIGPIGRRRGEVGLGLLDRAAVSSGPLSTAKTSPLRTSCPGLTR
jgi:hypothetical protein